MYERIKQLCKERGISVNKLEQELKIAKGSLCKMNSSKPSVGRAQKIANYFGVTVDYLMTGEEKGEQPYYLDDEARQMAEELAHNPNLHILFDAARTISKEDLQFVVDMVNRLKKENE